jgi:ankyrin repeat protein
VDDNGQTALHVAARVGAVPLYGELIRRGAELGQQDKSGCTPLWLAINNLGMLFDIFVSSSSISCLRLPFKNNKKQILINNNEYFN